MPSLSHRALRVIGIPQVVERHLEIGVVDRHLEDLAVLLEERGTGRFGLLQGLADRLLHEVALHWAVDAHQQTELPLGAGEAAFLREPDIQLSARQR